jgi:iron complex transport system substrate-binding protein
MRWTWLNAAAAAGAIGAGVLAALPRAGDPGTDGAPGTATSHTAATEPIEVAGQPALRDARGHVLTLRRFERIVGASVVADTLLHELCEPERVIAYSAYSASAGPQPWRYTAKGIVRQPFDIERLVGLRPDLMLVNSMQRRDQVELLRAAGIPVFDLGEMHGMSTLLPNIVTLGLLLGRPEQAQALARRFAQRMQAIARDVPEDRRPWGLYLAIYGNQIFGGTAGTSHHDVLRAAGVRDLAAARYQDWPRYTSEQLLQLDPELIVTHTGMAALVCRHPGLASLRVCRGEGRIVELDGAMLGHPGLPMLEAAEALFDAVHGSPAPDTARAVSP